MYCLKHLGWIYFMYLFIYSGLEFTVTFLMYHKLGYTSIDQAKMFVTTGVVMAVLQGSVVRRLPPKHIQNSAVIGLYLIVPAFITVGLAEDGKLLYAGMILFAICKFMNLILQALPFLIHRFEISEFFSDRIRGDVHHNTYFKVWKTRPKGNRPGHIQILGSVGQSFGTYSCLDRFVSHPYFPYRINTNIYLAAFWSVGSSTTYIIGGLLLLIPSRQLQTLKLSD